MLDIKGLEKYIYYQEDNILLLHGDCIEIMPLIPDKSIDLIVTDPPYGLNYNNGDLATNREKVFGGDVNKIKPRPIKGDNENESFELLKNMLIIAKNKLLKGGACCCCCCCGGGGPKPLFAKWTLLLDEIIGFKQAVIWDKCSLGMGIHYRRNYEFILIAQNGEPAHRWNGGKDTPNIWRISKIIPKEYEHPTVKPVKLFNKIIQIHSNKGDLILDPFIGSGTTAVACKELGRKCIGIDIDEKWLEVAKNRLKQEVLL